MALQPSIPVRRPKRAQVIGETVINAAVVLGAIIACSFVHLPSRRRLCFDCEYSLADMARLTAAKLAYEAYPQWQVEHPGQSCPGSIGDLYAYMNRNDNTKDPYGSPYEMTCTPKGVVIYSPGEDALRGTADDIWSDNR
jgi:hypothetical protein